MSASSLFFDIANAAVRNWYTIVTQACLWEQSLNWIFMVKKLLPGLKSEWLLFLSKLERNSSEEAEVAVSAQLGKRWLFFRLQILSNQIQFLQVATPYESDSQVFEVHVWQAMIRKSPGWLRYNTKENTREILCQKYENLFFFCALGFVDNETGNLGSFIIFSSPKEAKLFSCSYSSLLEARSWRFSTLRSPLVLQAPNKPQPVKYFRKKK